MAIVQKLESKTSTAASGAGERQISPNDSDHPSFIAANIGVSANISFRFISPWKAVGKWIRQLIGM